MQDFVKVFTPMDGVGISKGRMEPSYPVIHHHIQVRVAHEGLADELDAGVYFIQETQ